MAVLLAAARLFLADDKPVVHENVPAIAECIVWNIHDLSISFRHRKQALPGKSG
jgi:hypothetical protein